MSELRQRPGDQQLPVPNDREHIHDIVARELSGMGYPDTAKVATDLEARKQLGITRYGTPLQAFNNRDSLLDAYEEVLDGTAYLRTRFEELGAHAGFPPQGHPDRREWQLVYRLYQDMLGAACTLAMLMNERAHG